MRGSLPQWWAQCFFIASAQREDRDKGFRAAYRVESVNTLSCPALCVLWTSNSVASQVWVTLIELSGLTVVRINIESGSGEY